MTDLPPAPSHEIVVIPDFGQSGREELRQQCFQVRIGIHKTSLLAYDLTN